MLENQVEVRQREVVELQSQVKALGQDVKDTEEVDGRRQVLEKKFQDLLEPLQCRRNFLVASREIHQFNRDVEDEIVCKAVQQSGDNIRTCVMSSDFSCILFVFQLWVQERMAIATSTEHGHNLQTVQLLIKKNQVRL